jgi:hypothetical protein
MLGSFVDGLRVDPAVIAANTGDIAGNTGDIAANTARILALESQIAQLSSGAQFAAASGATTLAIGVGVGIGVPVVVAIAVVGWFFGAKFSTKKYAAQVDDGAQGPPNAI